MEQTVDGYVKKKLLVADLMTIIDARDQVRIIDSDRESVLYEGYRANLFWSIYGCMGATLDELCYRKVDKLDLITVDSNPVTVIYLKDKGDEQYDGKDMENEWNMTSNDIYLIEKGVRSCCLWTISRTEYGKVKGTLEKITRNNGLKIKTFDANNLNDYNIKIYIYKYESQGVIIDIIESMDHCYAQEWMLGKLLCYSDASAEDFYEKNYMNKK